MKYLILLSIFILSGCTHTTDISIKGTRLQTPYGSGDGEIAVHTTWGKVNAVNK